MFYSSIDSVSQHGTSSTFSLPATLVLLAASAAVGPIVASHVGYTGGAGIFPEQVFACEQIFGDALNPHRPRIVRVVGLSRRAVGGADFIHSAPPSRRADFSSAISVPC